MATAVRRQTMGRALLPAGALLVALLLLQSRAMGERGRGQVQGMTAAETGEQGCIVHRAVEGCCQYLEGSGPPGWALPPWTDP